MSFFNINQTLQEIDRSLNVSNKIMKNQKKEIQQKLIEVLSKYVIRISNSWLYSYLIDAKFEIGKILITTIDGYHIETEFKFKHIIEDNEEIGEVVDGFIPHLTNFFTRYDKGCRIRKEKLYEYGTLHQVSLSDNTEVYFWYKIITGRFDRYLTFGLRVEAPAKSRSRRRVR